MVAKNCKDYILIFNNAIEETVVVNIPFKDLWVSDV